MVNPLHDFLLSPLLDRSTFLLLFSFLEILFIKSFHYRYGCSPKPINSFQAINKKLDNVLQADDVSDNKEDVTLCEADS